MKTTTTYPDGSQIVTKTEKPLGCCGVFLWICIGGLVIGGPAVYFPIWAAVLAYVVEATVALLLLAGWISGRGKPKKLGTIVDHTAKKEDPKP